MTTQKDKKICFVISPIGDIDSETRNRSDNVLKHIISASVESIGYHVIRADKISEPGIITTQIIQHIVDSDLVIADLTERNPNVFYELALRHAIRKPLVQMIKKGESIPFDVAATRIIQFDIHDLDSVDLAKLEIISQVESLEAGKSEIHNPISVSLDLKMLKESGNAEERSLADVVEAISDLRGAVSSVDKKMSEEIKHMLETIPFRMESRFDIDLKRRKRRLYPMLFDHLAHLENISNDPYVSFLIMISFFKDDFPWVYEVGLETYKGLKSKKTKIEKKKLIESFEKIIELLSHPIMRDFYEKSDDLYMFSKEMKHLMHLFLDKYVAKDYEVTIERL